MAAWPRRRSARRHVEAGTCSASHGRLPRWPTIDDAIAQGLPAAHRSSAAAPLTACAPPPASSGACRSRPRPTPVRAGGAMSAPLARIRGGVHTSDQARQRASAMSPAARSISTMCRPCRARWKPRWCSARMPMPASRTSTFPRALTPPGRRRGHHRRRHPRPQRHRADQDRRAAAAGRSGRA